MEQEHFEKCLEIIKKNIMYYKKKVEKGKQEIENLYQSGLIDPLSVYLDIQEHLENTLRKNKAALQKPYFGRIDYQEEESNQKESLYIGKNGIFQDKTEIIIVDWRAPVSALYYENELGKGNYNVPEMGSVSVDLQLKRTFDIQQGKLLGYFDQYKELLEVERQQWQCIEFPIFYIIMKKNFHCLHFVLLEVMICY